MKTPEIRRKRQRSRGHSAGAAATVIRDGGTVVIDVVFGVALIRYAF
jgi:hypothetical protein